jgi:DNA-binding transcriptional regulator YbjK
MAAAMSTFGMQDIQALILIVGFVVTIGGGFVTYGMMRSQVSALEQDLKRARAKADQALADLKTLEVRVAREYVTTANLLAVEEKIVAAIHRLGDRLDRVLQDSRRP